MKGVLEEKSFQFAIKIVELNRYLVGEKKEYVLSKQVLRSGTSIGANVSEAQFGQSRADFLSKMSIALKEAHETRYWLRLLEASSVIDLSYSSPLLNECNELINILVATCKTTKLNAS